MAFSIRAGNEVMSDWSIDGVDFQENGIRFRNYPFPPASVYPDGMIAFDSIEEIDPAAAPPEVRAAGGEILFVPAVLKDRLREAAIAQKISLVRRLDVWDLMLEPFLDTEFDRVYQERALDVLEANGISREECLSIRDSVASAMYAYNFDSGLWDWRHLGLYDVLQAHQGYLSGKRHRLSPREFEEFYWRAMRLAAKGTIIKG